jgi:hypothetical protein
MGEVIVLTKRVYKQGDFVEYLGTGMPGASSRFALVITYQKELGVLEITPLGTYVRYPVSEDHCRYVRATQITGGLKSFVALHPHHGECIVFAEVLISGLLYLYVKTRTSNQSSPIPITEFTFLYSAVPGP